MSTLAGLDVMAIAQLYLMVLYICSGEQTILTIVNVIFGDPKMVVSGGSSVRMLHGQNDGNTLRAFIMGKSISLVDGAIDT